MFYSLICKKIKTVKHIENVFTSIYIYYGQSIYHAFTTLDLYDLLSVLSYNFDRMYFRRKSQVMMSSVSLLARIRQQFQSQQALQRSEPYMK